MEYTVTKASIEGTYKTGALPDSLTENDIEQVLGFAPTISCDRKVTRSWFFQVNGNPCGIWDYKGERWSTFDHAKVLPVLFAEVIAEVTARSYPPQLGVYNRLENTDQRFTREHAFDWLENIGLHAAYEMYSEADVVRLMNWAKAAA